MKKREFLQLGAMLGAAVVLPGCGGGSDTPVVAAQPRVVIMWNQALLTAIRATKPGPPMVARSLAIVHTAMYDAWAAYDAVAVGTRLHGALRQAETERTDANKTRAISYAAYAAALNQYPSQKAVFDAVMSTLGLTPGASFDRSKPDGVGNLAAQAVIDFRRGDGANQDGLLSASGVAYSDYTNYAPQNVPAVFTQPTPLSGIAAPDRWQQLTYFDGGVAKTPAFIGPHWRNVTPFALTSASQFRPAPPAALGSAAFTAQAQQVVDYLVNLTEKQKVIAEYWADGPNSELPPGHWNLFAQYVSTRDKYDNDKDVRLFFALTNAIFDASIATWECKRFYDYARPITAIRFLFNGRTIQGYGSGGPAVGLVPIQGEAWRTFQKDSFPTPPFPEYTSGHSAFSAAGAEVLKTLTGSDTFGNSVSIAAKTLIADPALPTSAVTLSWATFTDAANEAGISRLYGGIHFSDGNTVGLDLGRKVAVQAFAKAKSYWDGSAG
jgi:hypothetical protein